MSDFGAVQKTIFIFKRTIYTNKQLQKIIFVRTIKNENFSTYWNMSEEIKF